MAVGDFRATAISGSITRLVDGKSYIVAGANITVNSSSLLGGQVEISSTGGGGGGEWTKNVNDLYPNTFGTTTVIVGGNSAVSADILLAAGGNAIFNEQGISNTSFRVESGNRENAFLIKGTTDQVLIHSGGSGDSVDESAGLDVVFYVSGSRYTQSSAVRATSVFGEMY